MLLYLAVFLSCMLFWMLLRVFDKGNNTLVTYMLASLVLSFIKTVLFALVYGGS